MVIVHVSAECYPMAKAGGLGDVVGALPKYQNKLGDKAMVVMPMYQTPFLKENNWDVQYKGNTNLGNWFFDYTIIKESTGKLGYDLYLVDINGLLDRPKIYGYTDDIDRFIGFQVAVVNWLSHWGELPSIIHCHDHQAGLISFMMKYCYDYQRLKNVKTVLSIHNAQYQGAMGWDKSILIPRWDMNKKGLLEWNNCINSLAAGVKCVDKVTTVSPSYMQQLTVQSNGLELLFKNEQNKCVGILNGIDNEIWNPATDKMIPFHYDFNTVNEGKQKNKNVLCAKYNLDTNKPLVVFIGRLVAEKAADVLPGAIQHALDKTNLGVNFFIIGAGDTSIESALNYLVQLYPGHYNTFIGYDEKIGHEAYAAADFLLMPSRVEPCGLNQLYSLRYGTIPMVRDTGGLHDTVVDMGDAGGFGIKFLHANETDIVYSIERAIEVYKNKKQMKAMIQKAMKIDHSWESVIMAYKKVYQSIG
ncbi:MAG: glycogen synthase [Chitinophagia bacterium]|nr:glycogen synthase [Chitinophagia bacterium]NCA30319.1 glycogen synthase [Chitinophagia bacterium]NDD16795.1 glycogen synthase [Chitinophagia bacterium]